MSHHAAAGRVAVLLYGFPRTFQITAASLLKHVVEPLDADVFYFGPAVSDRPGVDHCGASGFNNVVRGHTKHAGEAGLSGSDPELLRRAYGPRLKRLGQRAVDPRQFEEWAGELDRDEWIFGVNPARFFAMAHNMAGAWGEMVAFERETGTKYDVVILTRPDLAFYGPIDVSARPGRVLHPRGAGFDDAGRPKKRGAQILSYRDAATGEAILPGEEFVDQILVFARADADHLADLDQALRRSARARVPLQAETLLYHHFVTRHGLHLEACPWVYEILRFDQSPVVNATDLAGIAAYDPTNPRARAYIRRHRGRTFVRNLSRALMRRLVHPLRELYRLDKRN